MQELLIWKSSQGFYAAVENKTKREREKTFYDSKSSPGWHAHPLKYKFKASPPFLLELELQSDTNKTL